MIRKLLLLGLLFLSVNSWGATQTVFINTDNSGAADGTTFATGYRYGDVAELASRQNLVTATNNIVFDCHGVTPDTTTITFNTGWTVGGIYNITYTKCSTSSYVLLGATVPNNTGVINIYKASTTISNMDISRFVGTSAGDAIYGINLLAGSISCNVYNNRIHDVATFNNLYGISNQSNTSATIPNNIYNNILYNLKSTTNLAYGINIVYHYNTNVYHNTLSSITATSNSAYGIRQQGAAGTNYSKLKNNIVGHCKTACYTGIVSTESTNNASRDLTAPTTGTFYTSIEPQFTDFSTGNLLLVSPTATGTDVRTDRFLPVINSINFLTRPATPDLGAYQNVVSTETPTVTYRQNPFTCGWW